MSSNPVISAKKSDSLDTIGNSRLLGLKKVKKAYEKKRDAKVLTKASTYKLFGLQSILNDDYRQAYMCNEYLFQNGNKITSNYCKKKCCTVCSRIQAAQHLAKYGNRILELDDLHLVTLTDKNVFKGELNDNVQSMFSALSRIKKNISKNYKDLKINGFRSFECTYTFTKGFNPHFHFIVEGKATAELLVKLWLKQMPLADAGGQNIKKVTHTKKSLLEVFKYIAKPVTKGYYSPTAYDEIMRSIKHRRVTDALGKIRGVRKQNEDLGSLDIDELKAMHIDFKGDRYGVWKYTHELYDYVTTDGELLLDSPLKEKTKKALKIIERSYAPQNEKRNTEQTLFYANRCKDYTALF